jgi:tRNA 2-thiouridine synthesizing protein C
MSILFIFNKPPYGGEQSKEALDMALAHAAFDEKVSLLFIDRGIWNLVDDQMPKIVGIREFTRLFKGLSLYDIEDVYLCETALESNKLSLEQLMIVPELVSQQHVQELISKHDRVLCL